MITMDIEEEQPTLLTKEEVSERWRGLIKPQTIGRMILKGELKGIRVGGRRILIPLTSVLAYERNNIITASPRSSYKKRKK